LIYLIFKNFLFFSKRSNHEIVMSIEQSFLSGSNIYIKNCNSLDSLLYPLAQWKVTSQKNNTKDGILFIYFKSK
jgi:hypothetical protein